MSFYEMSQKSSARDCQRHLKERGKTIQKSCVYLLQNESMLPADVRRVQGQRMTLTPTVTLAGTL